MLKVNAPGNLNIFQAAIRKVATYEIVDGDLLKENLWKYKLEEKVNYYLKLCGYSSNHFQFILGLPLYFFGLGPVVLLFLIVLNYFRRLTITRAEDFEGGER
jgi:hypothetical protein